VCRGRRIGLADPTDPRNNAPGLAAAPPSRGGRAEKRRGACL